MSAKLYQGPPQAQAAQAPWPGKRTAVMPTREAPLWPGKRSRSQALRRPSVAKYSTSVPRPRPRPGSRAGEGPDQAI